MVDAKMALLARRWSRIRCRTAWSCRNIWTGSVVKAREVLKALHRAGRDVMHGAT
jgi:hypothetical protein